MNMRLTQHELSQPLDRTIIKPEPVPLLEATQFEFVPPCHPRAGFKTIYYRSDFLLALFCRDCDRPIASFLIAEEERLPPSPEQYPAWAEHHRRVVHLHSLMKDPPRSDPEHEADRLLSIKMHKKLVRNSWLALPPQDQQLALGWHCGTYGMRPSIYLGDKEPSDV